MIQLSLLDQEAVREWMTAYPSPTLSDSLFGVESGVHEHMR
jgi:hypothetical protein